MSTFLDEDNELSDSENCQRSGVYKEPFKMKGIIV
jgi:hypothetical protein